MRRQPISRGQSALMAGFCLSCAALLLFLWSSFGGVVPLRPHGYRVQVALAETGTLGPEADVRIAGVTVGRVVAMEPTGGRTVATLELDDQASPLPRDARATLRQKTVLGEAYLELSQGSRRSGTVPEGGRLPAASVRTSVEFDEVLRAFDPRTRAALRRWLDEQERGTARRGADLNAALGDLPGTERALTDLLDALDGQGRDLGALVRDTGTVFTALGERRGQLARLLRAGDRVFAATASRTDQLAATFRALPALERETRAALPALAAFARRQEPVVARLRPAARQTSSALAALQAVAPDLRGALTALRPLSAAAQDGLPAVRRLLADLRPALGDTDAPLAQLEPLVRHIARYRREVTAFLGNATAATQATAPDASGTPRHYLRTTNPINPEALAAQSSRLPTSRANPYPAPGAGAALARGLATASSCGGTTPAFAGGALDALTGALASTLDALTLQGGSPAAPACRVDGRAFPHVTPRPLGRVP
ncbi:MlaD family protein [Conexibacter sp. SYSU D00693]|uniref:MlaD family protein n=1 Tax=Conexibacter sp. SYSU D00693 TaxID=2812560 RepID=UPI00196A8ABB|nr:MlaD family protein [Conexibacter sp. SYSU D00693]